MHSPQNDSASTCVKSQATNAKADKLIEKLVKLWKAHEGNGLEVRWKTGALLNKQLGAPTKRQPHGKAVLKKAGSRLGISESELSRMRWFAHHFAGLTDFKSKYPDAGSWAKVKDLLPGLNPKKASEPAPSAGRVNAPHGTVLLSKLKAVRSFLREFSDVLSAEDREQISTAFKELFDIAKDRLQLGISIA